MKPTWRKRDPEIERATQIILDELPELQDDLLPIPDAGKAVWVNESYEDGMRGEALDYRTVDWEKFEGRSSSTSLGSDAEIRADGEGAIVDRSVPSAERWIKDIEKPGWPFRPCLTLVRENASFIYFDRLIQPEKHEFTLYRVYAELSQRHKGVVANVEVFPRLRASEISPSHLYSAISRLRRYLRNAAADINPASLRNAARVLVPSVAPQNVRRQGYVIQRPELIRIR